MVAKWAPGTVKAAGPPTCGSGIEREGEACVQVFCLCGSAQLKECDLNRPFLSPPKKQVVQGVKYYLTMELVNTQCAKKGGVALSSTALDHCALPPENKQQVRRGGGLVGRNRGL